MSIEFRVGLLLWGSVLGFSVRLRFYGDSVVSYVFFQNAFGDSAARPPLFVPAWKAVKPPPSLSLPPSHLQDTLSPETRERELLTKWSRDGMRCFKVGWVTKVY